MLKNKKMSHLILTFKEETWYIKNQLTNRKDTDRMKLTGSEEAMAEML